MATATKKPRYQPHPMLAREKNTMAKLAESTGKTFAQWVELSRKKGVTDKWTLKQWLMKEHGLLSMNADWVVHAALSNDVTDYDLPEPLVDALYSGPREALRPLHEKVVDAALALGKDVIVTACKTMVPIYRKHVFAELAPVEGGVQVRLALGDLKEGGRLERGDARTPGERLTHQVILRGPKEVDAEFRKWLARAYELGAERMEHAVGEAEPPADLAKALKSSSPAAQTWDTCTPAMRRDFIEWIVSAKQEETRARRVTQTIQKLAAGKKRAY